MATAANGRPAKNGERTARLETLPFANIPSVRAKSRKNRVYVLREFLLATYKDYLSPGDIVLDIAGGKGSLSWLLTNVDGITSIVVDPRIAKSHASMLKSIAFLRSHPEEARQRAIPHLPTHQPLAGLLQAPRLSEKKKDADFIRPKHFRILVDEDLVQAVRNAKEEVLTTKDGGSCASWSSYWAVALAKGLEANTLGYEEKEDNEDNNTSPKSAQEDSGQAALEMMLKCRLVIGFHPDQATDSCFDLATALGVPFCVVPCCVFPAQFPHRRLPDGRRVRDYNGLLEYLKLKMRETTMYTASLAFHETTTARNTVLYSLPPRAQDK